MEQSNENLATAEQAVLDEAAKVNSERMDAVQKLAATVARRVDLEKQVAETIKEERRLANAAEKAGWTAAQVKRFVRKAKEQPGKRTTPTPDQTRQDDHPAQGENADATSDSASEVEQQN